MPSPSDKIVGSLEWMKQSGGRLSARDRLVLLGQGMRMQGAELAGRFRHLSGERPISQVAEDDLVLPDSQATADALELAREELDLSLLNHSLRTYVWGALLAKHQGLGFDHEQLAVAALCHDVGLAAGASHSGCFTSVGADAAARLAERHQLADRTLAAEAITMHMNLNVTPDQGHEAYLLTAGAQLDVIGRRSWLFARGELDTVTARYPREQFKQRFRDAMAEQRRLAPGTRATFYHWLGTPLLIRLAPFDE
jgi:hypothetical protein